MVFPQMPQESRPVGHSQPARHQAGQALHRAAAAVPGHQPPEQGHQRPPLQEDTAVQGQGYAQPGGLFPEQGQGVPPGAENGRLPKGDLALQQIIKGKQRLVFLPVALDKAQAGGGRLHSLDRVTRSAPEAEKKGQEVPFSRSR